MGCIGLRRVEFEALTPKQFNAIYRQWRERQDSLSRERWETARLTGMLSMSPWLKKRKLKASEIYEFPWEKSTETPDRPVPKSTQERFEQIQKLWQ